MNPTHIPPTRVCRPAAPETSDFSAISVIPPDTEIGAVELTVSELERSRRFYEAAVGLRAVGTGAADTLTLAGADRVPLLRLHGDPGAPPRDPRQTGLFHFALRVPTRRDLATALLRLARAGWRLTGASDHLVSEALYMHDPDGNGVEIFRDRPRSEWPREPSGNARMATLPLDLDALLDELGDGDGSSAHAEAPAMPAGTRVGHVHLQVSELHDSEAFYSGLLGFDVTVRTYPGALFLSAGGYHHHIAVNTWNSRGAGAPEAGAVGLRAFEIVLPDAAAQAQALERLDAGGVPSEPSDQGALVRDPSGNGVLLKAAA